MITAEEFVIKVKADCQKAISALNTINKETKENKQQVDIIESKWVKASKRIGYAIGTGIGASLITVIGLTKKLGSAILNVAKSIGSGIIKLVTAPFRLLKNIITGIGKIFKKIGNMVLNTLVWNNVNKVIRDLNEGIEDAYQYSKLFDGSLSKALDNLASKGGYLKSAVGALSGVFMQAIEPYLSAIMNWFADLINRISKLLAEMFALPDYLQANSSVLKQWSDNVKATKQLISGIDELNMFNNGDNNSYGSLFTTVKTDTSSVNYGALTSIDKFFDWLRNTALPSVKSFWNDKVKPAFVDIKNWWDGTVKPAIAQWWEDKANPAIINLWDDIKNRIMPRLDEWFYGIRQADEDENGNVYTRIVEPGFIDGVKTWISSVGNWLVNNWDNIKQNILDIWNTNIKPVITGIGTLIYESLNKAWNEFIQPTLSNFWKTTVGDPIVSNQLKEAYDHTDKMESWSGAWRWLLPPEIGRYIGEKIGEAAGWGIYSDKYKDLRPNALGGVYTSPTAVLVGESSSYSNPELITPTALLDSRLQANNTNLINAWSQMTNQIIGAINQVDMSVNIGDSVIAQSASRGQNNYYKLTGKSLIK